MKAWLLVLVWLGAMVAERIPAWGDTAGGGAVRVTLAERGVARLPIVVADQATQETKDSAAKLAEYLGKISGAKFEVRTGDGSQGIAVGREADFPKLRLGVEFRPDETTRREEYLLRCHPDGVWLIGATDLAVRHAVWDCLHRIGYRQFFPGPNWEIIPNFRDDAALAIAVDAFERPSFHSRRIWYGFGTWEEAKGHYRDWCDKNRAPGGVTLNTGHAYDGIVKGLAKGFELHPEYWPELGGVRQVVRNPKPCLGNPDVRRAMIGYVISRLDQSPDVDSVSIDPSDGGGWCECAKCAGLGSVSDQAITLANELAEAIDKKHPGKFVGIYAYNYHSAPPSIRVHPNVVVSVATAFIKGGQTLDELLGGWSKQGATRQGLSPAGTVLGIREYYSVNTWDRDQPGQARGGNLDYLRQTIPDFYARGARHMSAESSDNWGPNGLGYYFANRMLWDVDESEQQDAIVDDFLTKCFGKAKGAMADFYQQLDGSKPHLVSSDQLGRMYRAIGRARELAETPAIHRRLDDLTLYTHYAELYGRYARSDPQQRQGAFEALIKFAYRMRRTMMVHSYALYRDLGNRDKSVTIPTDARWQVPEGANPWKSSEGFARESLDELVRAGIESSPLVELDFTPVSYGNELVPAKGLVPASDPPAGGWGAGRGVQTFHTYVDRETTLTLKVTGGLIAHYRDRGNVKVELWKVGGASQSGERETLIASDRSTPPNGKEATVSFLIKEPGHYRVTVSDGNDRTLVVWPDSLPCVVRSTQAEGMNGSYGEWMGYFYVPAGTKVIGFFGGEHGEIRDAEDRPQFWLNGKEPNFYSVDVPAGQDGKVWRVRYVRGSLRLLTVPPYFARAPKEILLPQEVVAMERK